jgi:hypothetical protein
MRLLQVKQYRKDIAELLRQGKKDYARIRVEAVIRENMMLQALEVLELYIELLAVRSALIAQTKEIPRDMIEAISSVLYASQRVMGAFCALRLPCWQGRAVGQSSLSSLPTPLPCHPHVPVIHTPCHPHVIHTSVRCPTPTPTPCRRHPRADAAASALRRQVRQGVRAGGQ